MPVETPPVPTVRRAFSSGGIQYQPGDPFPWRDLGFTDRRVRQMFDAGTLTMDPPEALAHLRPPEDREGVVAEVQGTAPPHRR